MASLKGRRRSPRAHRATEMLSRVICLVLLAGAAHAALNDGCDPSVAGQCSDVANSYCDETSFTCLCNDRYLETSTGKCDGVLGRSCNVDWAATCNKVSTYFFLLRFVWRLKSVIYRYASDNII